MSAAPSTQPTSTWTEPPWSGWIETTGDALLILEAARRGLIPRVTRRLVDSERKMITSGSVFVFDEDESGIKRWTDGFFWSPSRILGNFLLYRETDKRGAGHRGARSEASPPDVGEQYALDASKPEAQSLSRPKNDEAHLGGVDKQRERNLLGSLTNSYKFKPDGLMKKTFSLTIGGVSQHLISYYRIEDVTNGRLRSPSSLPELASLDISPEYLDKTHFRNPPKVEIGVDGRPRYRGEADDIDPSSPLSPALLTALPLLTDGRVTESPNTGKHPKRFEPYPAPQAGKRSRRQTKSGIRDPTTPADQQQPQEAVASPPIQPSSGYVNSSIPVTLPPAHYPPYAPVQSYYAIQGYTTMPPSQSHAHPHPSQTFYPAGGAPPPQAPGLYPYAYPPGPNSNPRHSAQDVQQQQHTQQAYYPYPPQPQGPPYGAPWPAYAAYAHVPPPPAPQSSIANANQPPGHAQPVRLHASGEGGG
ncbi:hypothetical protein H0H81_005267 [Sphagnurus paluster]|uniref:Uncharacterized protein n=1 Tax=Sphagnurus paluster TaxID=117069 RepID=A0A9P7KL61_9AGAR|nr:hypothetical protein H0H81_005267 [Sphagnurus paluster]